MRYRGFNTFLFQSIIAVALLWSNRVSSILLETEAMFQDFSKARSIPRVMH